MTLARQSLASSPGHSSLRGLEMRLNKVHNVWSTFVHCCIVCSAGGDRCNRASRTTSLCEEAVEDARQYSRSDTTFSN